jgi:anti-sigma regulatory factor (Ser/Thr protein kinase)
VKHAYQDGTGSVDIVYELHGDRLAVEVGDAGAGFEAREDGTDLGGDLEEGGLGIAIIRAVTDEVEIGKREGGGSRLRFVKLLDD